MPSAEIGVAVTRYGVVRKRVAGAVALKDDMELVGIADVASRATTRPTATSPIPAIAHPGIAAVRAGPLRCGRLRRRRGSHRHADTRRRAGP